MTQNRNDLTFMYPNLGQGGMVSNTTEEAAGVEETDSGNNLIHTMHDAQCNHCNGQTNYTHLIMVIHFVTPFKGSCPTV